MTLTVNNANLLALIGNVPTNTVRIVDEIAGQVRETASQLAPVLTGSLQVSVYVGTPNGSDYGQQSSAARALNPDVRIADEVRAEFALTIVGLPDSAYLDVVGVAAGHGIFQELGTRYMAPQSFLFPAVESVRAEFLANAQHIVDF